MEMKPYQQQVVNELELFIQELENTSQLNMAFDHYWLGRGIKLHSIESSYLKPYDNSIAGVPRLTIKVPTAGGKTFIACNALRSIFASFPLDKPQVVVWFVPSDTILKQTLRSLKDSAHPYRQKIDSHFASRVRVYEKSELLLGANFNPVEIKQQLSILVLSVQSFTAKNKEARKAFQENGYLAQFPATFSNPQRLLADVDETALMQVINQLNPVVIIDESHNMESELRVDTLVKINPSFILELTATPRDRSNIISFVDSMELKKNNMVKLPVIVYNHHDSTQVISSAIQLQRTLEAKAQNEEQFGGKYIRPIVLFQAQPKNSDDNVTFERIKEQLIAVGIPEEQVKIKTSNKDEIKQLDLMSRDCSVRFIITVNALKEGWDCPFAYVLASLANKSSVVDVEQILGRILRQPYVMQHQQELLNFSYVLTASANFLTTLDKIVVGLNKSGFSSKDYRVHAENSITENFIQVNASSENLFTQEDINVGDSNAQDDTVPIINVEQIRQATAETNTAEQVEQIVTLAKQTHQNYQEAIKEHSDIETTIPNELGSNVKTYPLKDIYLNDVLGLTIPSFYIQVENDSLFFAANQDQRLTKDLLLKDFELSKQDTQIDFSQSTTEMFRVDLAEGRKNEFVPEYRKEDPRRKAIFSKYIASLPAESQITQLSERILGMKIHKIDAIPQPDLRKYIVKVLEGLNSEQLSDVAQNEFAYADKIRKKILALAERYAEKSFNNLLDKGLITCKPDFNFPSSISPTSTVSGIVKSLYLEEGEMNEFERKIINDVANLDNVVFWHRNLERGKGLQLNGFINHYPDFIVKTAKGKIILIETKGTHLDGSDSISKLHLGNKWAASAGENYRYFMVFEKERLDGAKTISDLLEIVSAL